MIFDSHRHDYDDMLAFVNGAGVWEQIQALRNAGHSNIGFEMLFLAASQGGPAEGLAFLRSGTDNKIPTTAARNLNSKRSRSDVPDLKLIIKKLKTFRSRLDFSYLGNAKNHDSKEVRKEIELTIFDLTKTLDRLKRYQEEIE